MLIAPITLLCIVYKNYVINKNFLSTKEINTLIKQKINIKFLELILGLFVFTIFLRAITDFPMENFAIAFTVFATTNIKFSLQTKLIKITIPHNQKRFMLSGRSVHTARLFYYGLSALSNTDNLNNSTKNNHKPIINSLVELSLDNTRGTPQHKEAFFTYFSSQRFSVDHFYQPFLDITGHKNISWDSNTLQDFRIFKELAVLDHMISRFQDDILEVVCTNDSASFTPLTYQKQKNPDWKFLIKSKINGETFDKILGINLGSKNVIFDEKAGRNMFKHSSSGSVGLLTYDSSNENVQIMSAPITAKELLAQDRVQIDALKNVIINDKCSSSIHDVLNVWKNHLIKFNSNDTNDIFKKRNEFQRDLWSKILCDPSYQRSISFVFTDHPQYSQLDMNGQTFEKRFISLLTDKMYRLEKTQDRRDIFRAMLIAYKETIDPKIIEKLQYLNSINFIPSRHFLDDLASFIKSNLT